MIVIRVWGGIGNQLFQYSFGEYLRLKTQQEVVYDIASFGRTDKYRKLELDIINPDIPTIENIKFSHYTGLNSRILRSFFCLNHGNKFVEESHFAETLLSNINPSMIIYLQGYWQKDLYPNKVLEYNPNCFIPYLEKPIEIQTIEDEIKTNIPTIALHIRRGDYYNSKNIKSLAVCTPDYYYKALNFLYEKNNNYCRTIIFSDELEWVKDNINLPQDVFFVPNYNINSFWYIYLMSCCSHNIIANSSFSWWGAYLNKNKDKIVIAPQKWIINSNKEMALPEWIKI